MVVTDNCALIERNPGMNNLLGSLPARAHDGLVNIVVDTPKGSRNKFKYDSEAECFRLSRILPAGTSFPYDFGSIPKTLGEDGDALDVLVISDAASFTGCLLSGKLIGVISAEQTENGNTIRNDRLLAVPVTPANHPVYGAIDDLPKYWVDELEHFFRSYNAAQGRIYNTIGRGGPGAAEKALAQAERNYLERRK